MVRLTTLAVCLLAPALGATVLIPAEFREIVNGSDIIAHARVVDVRAEWAEGRRRIDSIVTVEVLSYFKGGAEQRVSFTVPGGQIGRYRSIMVGAPSFRTGEEAVLFLNAGDAAVPYVFGLNQGVFRIRQDRTSGRRIVLPPALLATGTTPEVVRRGSPERRPVSLEVFGAQLRAVLAEQRGGAR
jgi:hypothetical protein